MHLLSLRMLPLICILSICPTFVVAAEQDPTNPPQGRFIDEWAEVYMAGGKVGYAHSTMSRTDNRINTQLLMVIRMGRAGEAVEIKTTNKTQETVDGVPIGFASEMDMSFMKTSMTGTVTGDRIKVASSQLGMQQVQEYPMPKGALMTWGLYRATLQKGFEPGLTYTLRTYAPELRLDDAVEAVIKVGEWESFSAGKKTRRGQRMETSLISPLGSLESVAWMNKEGSTLKQQIAVPGLGNLEVITCDQSEALADFVPPEVFMATVIPAGRRLEPKSIQQIRYRIKAKDGQEKVRIPPETGMQKVSRNQDGSVLLEVSRQIHRKSKNNKAANSNRASESMAEFLEPNLLINIEDPELIKLAKVAAGDEKDPFKLGDKLRKFVTDYVKDKSLNVGFASASEVCRNREGDCSEHGVLLAALGRLNGLPSRVVVGLAYVPAFGGQTDVFGYHMWTQFHMDGRWIDFDAALRESDCSPTRIAFATSSLKNSGLADLSLPLLKLIGVIDLEILDVDSAPTTDQ